MTTAKNDTNDTIELMERVREIALSNAECALDQRDDARSYATHADCYTAHAANVLDTLRDEKLYSVENMALALRVYWSRIDSAVRAEAKAAASIDRELAINIGRSAANAATDARLACGHSARSWRKHAAASCEAERLSAEHTKLALATFTKTLREIKAERKAERKAVV